MKRDLKAQPAPRDLPDWMAKEGRREPQVNPEAWGDREILESQERPEMWENLEVLVPLALWDFKVRLGKLVNLAYRVQKARRGWWEKWAMPGRLVQEVSQVRQVPLEKWVKWVKLVKQRQDHQVRKVRRANRVLKANPVRRGCKGCKAKLDRRVRKAALA